MPTDPDAYVKLVGTRIRAGRKASGLTLGQAAAKLGCAVQNWQRLERGQNVGVHMLARVANVLGTTPGALALDETAVRSSIDMAGQDGDRKPSPRRK